MIISVEYIPVIPSTRAIIHDGVDHTIQERIPFLREGRLAVTR